MSWGSRESLKLQAGPSSLTPLSSSPDAAHRTGLRPSEEERSRRVEAPGLPLCTAAAEGAFPSALVGPLYLGWVEKEPKEVCDRSNRERCEGAQGSAAREAEGKMVTGSPRQRSAYTTAGHVVGLCSLPPGEGALADSHGQQLPSTACHMDQCGQRAFGRREWLVVANGAERPSTRKFTGLSSKVLVVGEQH